MVQQHFDRRNLLCCHSPISLDLPTPWQRFLVLLLLVNRRVMRQYRGARKTDTVVVKLNQKVDWIVKNGQVNHPMGTSEPMTTIQALVWVTTTFAVILTVKLEVSGAIPLIQMYAGSSVTPLLHLLVVVWWFQLWDLKLLVPQVIGLKWMKFFLLIMPHHWKMVVPRLILQKHTLKVVQQHQKKRNLVITGFRPQIALFLWVWGNVLPFTKVRKFNLYLKIQEKCSIGLVTQDFLLLVQKVKWPEIVSNLAVLLIYMFLDMVMSIGTLAQYMDLILLLPMIKHKYLFVAMASIYKNLHWSILYQPKQNKVLNFAVVFLPVHQWLVNGVFN